MNNAALLTAPVTSEALERAGLRLELAYSIMLNWRTTGDDAQDERSYGAIEYERDAARKSYHAMFELITGLSAETVQRRLSI